MGNCFTNNSSPDNSVVHNKEKPVGGHEIKDPDYEAIMQNSNEPLRIEEVNLREKNLDKNHQNQPHKSKPSLGSPIEETVPSQGRGSMQQSKKSATKNSGKGVDPKSQHPEPRKQPEKLMLPMPIEDNTDGVKPYMNLKVSPDLFVNIKKGSFTQDYTSGRVLGEGAYGKVCLVTHKKTNKIRAMKAIKRTGVREDKEQNMLEEVSILTSLDHPNIVKLFELYKDRKYYYLVTEYCKGGELFDKIQQIRAFSEAQAALYMKQILGAMVYCHQKGIVHRDLKPENLLFVSKKGNSELKVIDFGVSMKYKKGTKMREKFGTPYYIAPEVIARDYDEKCDIWSCGVILFILLCGYPPFNGNDDKDIMKAVQKGKFSFDDPDWDPISQSAKDFITKLLTFKPSKRLSAKDALNDPWITKNASSSVLSTKVVQNLTNFNAKNKFRQAMLTFMATQMSAEKDKEQLMTTFKAMDKDNNGILSKEELRAGISQIPGFIMDNEEVDKMIKKIDGNDNGEVDYTEFIVATINLEKLLSAKKIEQTFKMFDQDGNGFIEKHELRQVMGGLEINDFDWKTLIEDIDEDNDGKINLKEFIKLLTHKKI